MNIIVNSDRTVEKEYTEKDGSQNENRVTELNFTLPEEYSGEGFVPKIAFITEDGNFSDYIDNGKYILKNNITKYREVICFVWLTNSVNNIDFRSQTFPLEFYYNEDPSDYIPSEQEKSQIELLMEELEEKIQEVTELEENVYTKDETYSKEEVDEIIPTDISDLNNDSGFIDKDVNNLTNYYKKSETYTKQEIDGKISSVYKYKGTVASYNNLPSTGLTIGDVYNVEDTGDNYAWIGTDWDKLGGDIDLSGYQEKIDNSHKLNADLVDDTSTTHKFTSTSEKSTWNAKYDKPSGGIPKTDLSEEVKEDLEKSDEALDQIETIEEDLYGNIDVEAEESSIKLSGTKDGRDVSIKKIYGNSTQVQYSGKNKWSLGNISINGTYENSTSLLLGEIYFETGNYTINLSKELINSSYLYIGPSGSIATNIIKQSTFSVSEAGSYAVRCVRQSGIYNNFEALVQLEQGSTATNYEPYVGGTASPNPTYKQDINNVEGDVVAKAESRNILSYPVSFEETINGIVYKGSNGVYNINGVSTGNADSSIYSIKNYTIKSDDYIHVCNNSINSNVAIALKCSDNTTISIASSVINRIYSLNTYIGKTITGIYFHTNPGITVNNLILSPMILNNVSTVTDFVIHKENSVTFPLSQGQKLMLGDTLEDDGVHHKREQVVFNGTENWGLANFGNYYRTQFDISNAKTFSTDENSTALCNSFTYDSNTFNSNTAKIGQFAQYRNYRGFFFITDKATLEEWKAYLAQQYANNTPVIVEYELAEEVIDPYTEEQQEAYNKLQKMKQYDDITYITIDKVNKFDLSYDEDRINVLLSDVNDLKEDKEDKSNKITSIDENSTDEEYPSAKAVYDELAERDEEISSLKSKNAQLIADHPDILDENNEFPSGTDLILNGTGDLEMSVDVGGNSTQGSLPNEYQQVEYIESSGTQYIDTGVIPNSYTGVEISASVSVENSADKMIIGSREGNNRFWIDFDGSDIGSNHILAGYGNYLRLPGYELNTIYNIKFNLNNNKKIIVNNTEYSLENYTYDNTNAVSLYMFRANYSSAYSGSFKCYMCKIYSGSTIVRDFIPCYRKSDNVIGLYDVANNAFYTNQGTETFTKGNDIPNPTYKQDINNVEGDVVVKGSSKNWFDRTEMPNADNWASYAGGKILRYKLKPNTQYTLSSNVPQSTENLLHFNGTSTATNGVYNGKTVTQTSDNEGNLYVGFYTNRNYYNEVLNGIYYVQLEEGTTATPYVPFAENSVTFPLSQGQKLMLGDTLEDDGIHHKKLQLVFDGTENWRQTTTLDNYIAYNLTLEKNAIKNSSNDTSTNEALCTIAKYNWYYNYLQENQFTLNNDTLRIVTDKVSTVEEFKSYLAQQYANNTPVIVEYELKTETIESYTSAQQTAYNKLKEMQSYYDLTYVTGSSDNAQPILTVQAKKSLKVINDEISNLNSRLTLLEE